jgi:hypothetical protein
MRIDVDEIETIVRTQVMKREIVEGDEAATAQARVNKFYRKGTTPRRKKETQAPEPPAPSPAPEESMTDRLLREARETEASQQSNPGKKMLAHF